MSCDKKDTCCCQDKAKLGCTCPFAPVGSNPPLFFSCPEMQKVFFRRLVKVEACIFSHRRSAVYGPGLGFGVWHPAMCCCKGEKKCCKEEEKCCECEKCPCGAEKCDCKEKCECTEEHKCCEECKCECKEGECKEKCCAQQMLKDCPEIPQWIKDCPDASEHFIRCLVKIHARNMCMLVHKGDCAGPHPPYCRPMPPSFCGPCCSPPCCKRE